MENYICNCGKKFEKQSSLNSHARFCEKYVKMDKKTYTGYCECGKFFEKSQSLNAHYSHCKIHKDDINVTDRLGNNRGWSKGLTKNTDDRVMNISINYSANMKNGITIPSFKGKKHSLESRIKMSITRSDNNNHHCKFFKISNGIKNFKLQGTYERDFAIFLNESGVKWDRSRIRYDSTHHYTPDFYLLDYNIYIEIKGWLSDRDIIKYRKFLSEHDIEIYCCFKKDLDKILIREIEFKDLPLLKSFLI